MPILTYEKTEATRRDNRNRLVITTNLIVRHDGIFDKTVADATDGIPIREGFWRRESSAWSDGNTVRVRQIDVQHLKAHFPSAQDEVTQ